VVHLTGYLHVLCLAPPSGLTCLVHSFMLIPRVFMSHSLILCVK